MRGQCIGRVYQNSPLVAVLRTLWQYSLVSELTLWQMSIEQYTVSWNFHFPKKTMTFWNLLSGPKWRMQTWQNAFQQISTCLGKCAKRIGNTHAHKTNSLFMTSLQRDLVSGLWLSVQSGKCLWVLQCGWIIEFPTSRHVMSYVCQGPWWNRMEHKINETRKKLSSSYQALGKREREKKETFCHDNEQHH